MYMCMYRSYKYMHAIYMTVHAQVFIGMPAASLGIREWPIPHWQWNRPVRGTSHLIYAYTSMQCRVCMCI